MLGLQALHDKGYVYRDLKPENCLLAEDGRVKLTDLGLAVKVTPKLHGAAGTRGYWAPEMLKRDTTGKRLTYDHMVDWFSFGCMLAEFISGTNPFRSEKALNFGLAKAKEQLQTQTSNGSSNGKDDKEKKKDEKKRGKEKAIDCATLEMHPEFDSELFSEEAADICRLLLDKDPTTRLGSNGCKEIMSHPYFGNVNWEEIISDRAKPPFLPPRDVNAASQSEIGTFGQTKELQNCVLDDKDEANYRKWDFTSTKAYATEVIEFLIYERETGKPLLPMDVNGTCCCAII
jgi:serine/threonine protein kinase